MSASGGPNIITDGLIFAIDAGSKRSYSGTGTSVIELSRNHSGGTLSGGTSFESHYLNFDGSNDSLAFATDDIFERGTLPFTMEAWVRLNDNTGTSNISAVMGGGNPLCDNCDGGYFIYFMGSTSKTINLRFDNSGLNNMDSLSYTRNTTFEDGKFYHIVGLRDGTNTKIYLDGTLVATGTDNATNVNDISTFYVSGWSNYRGDMDVAVSKIYNQSLSASQILQNYNASKSRFGK